MTINIGARMGVRISNGIAIGPSIGVQLAGRGGGPKFLFRDDFLTDEAAPLASPRTAEPGPGEATISDSQNKLSIVDGELAVANGSDVLAMLYSGDLSRVGGLASLYEVTPKGASLVFKGGFDWNASGDNPHSIFFGPSNEIRAQDSLIINNVGAFSVSTTYRGATICRSTAGLLYAIKGGIYTDWTLLWVSTNLNAATVQAAWGANGNTSSFSIGTVRALLLPAPFNTDYGLATDRIEGAVSVGQTFSHEADCIIEWTQTALPTSPAQHRILFRFQDEDNHWHARVTSAGNFELYERVGGSLTLRGVASGVVSAGHRCVVICDGTTIRGYSNDTLRWTYSSATNFATATGGRLEATGSSTGTVSDLVTWPRTLSGQAAALLDKAIA